MIFFFFFFFAVFFFFFFFFSRPSTEHDKISDFDLKLMEIESDSLGIPETEYKAVVNMPSAELQVRLHKHRQPSADLSLVVMTTIL
jgi:proliferating cell nuclear antigen